MVRGGGAPDPGRPTRRQEAPPPGTLMPPPQRAKPPRKSARCGVGDGSPSPHPPHPQQVGSGPRPHARKDEWSGWESARPRTPRQKAPSPRAPSCRPHSAQSQHARARAVGLVTGFTPASHAPTASGWWAPAARRKGRVVGGGRASDPGRPTPRQEAPPPGTVMPPPKRAKPAHKSARCGVGDGSPRPHPPHGERAAPSQVGGNGTGPPPPPPKQAKRSTGPRQDTRRGTDRVERLYQRPAPGPREMRTPHQPGEGGGRGRRESASAQTHKGHAGKPRRATRPSPRDAQTAWNGIPASEDKEHPDGTARHTQRRKRGAGRGKRGRHNTRHRPQPSRSGRERRAHATRALHPPRQ